VRIVGAIRYSTQKVLSCWVCFHFKHTLRSWEMLFLGLFFAAIRAAVSWSTFINGNVSPDVAAGLTVATFALILGAFGLIAVRVNL
jgi:hypothetical protein